MKKLKVFYNNNQSTDMNDSFSPSAGKPKVIAEEFAKNPQIEIISNFSPLTIDEICVAHDRSHVEQVMSCVKPNGFGNKIKEVAETFPWTNGSFYAAAEHALINKEFTMSPTSGFHHAEYKLCEGYCTFNGLMISAILLTQKYNVKKIGIVDIDAHYGNGTVDIIQVNNIKNIEHYTFGEHAPTLKQQNLFDRWLADFETTVLKPQFGNCDIILYQAGADPHINDPYGEYLTTKQMKERDKIVFSFAKKNNIPLVWNLAGGYQKPLSKVIHLHTNTLEECLNNLL